MKSWFFEKINKIDKLLARLSKKKKKTHINKIRNERGDVAPDIYVYIYIYTYPHTHETSYTRIL